MTKMEEADAANRLQVMLAPNPVKDMLNKMLNDFVLNQPLGLILMIADGKLVQSQSFKLTIKGQQVRMDLCKAAAANYLLQARQPVWSISRQMVIFR